MIEATLYFEKIIHITALIKALKTLPASIRPVYFAEDEGKITKANKLTDEMRFQTFLKKNPIGFFLYAENKTCIDISLPTTDYASITLYMADELSPQLVVAFFQGFSNYQPVFGYACEYDEYKHRNRHFITIGINHIESWIGRKLDKYISGVYWYTLLSDKLLKQHKVNLVDLAVEAIAVETLGDGSLHLLKFFERPEEWKSHIDYLDNLCERVEGVFSRRIVEKAVIGVSTFLEYDSIIADWR